MSTLRLVSAALMAAVLLTPGATEAQTANGSPTAPASPGRPGTPRPVSRTAPSVGPGRATPDAKLPADRMRQAKPTAAERAEQRQLEHDLHICIGC